MMLIRNEIARGRKCLNFDEVVPQRFCHKTRCLLRSYAYDLDHLVFAGKGPRTGRRKMLSCQCPEISTEEDHLVGA